MLFFWVQNFEFQYFWGYEDFLDIFGGSSQNWTIFRGYFYAFKGQGSEWRIFFGLLKFQIFIWGA